MHRPRRDPVYRIPGKRRQPRGSRLAAHRLQDLDRKGFEELGKPAPVFGPGHLNLFDHALGTVHAWNIGNNERLPLHRVQMLPAPAVIARGSLSANRTEDQCLAPITFHGWYFQRSLSGPSVPFTSYPYPPKSQTLPLPSVQVALPPRPPGRLPGAAVPSVP